MRFFLVYFSDNFGKTFEKYGRIYCWHAVDTNLFQLRYSIQKHAGSKGIAKWGYEASHQKKKFDLKIV